MPGAAFGLPLHIMIDFLLNSVLIVCYNNQERSLDRRAKNGTMQIVQMHRQAFKRKPYYTLNVL